MMPAAKHFDPIMGVDVHIIQPPGPVPPVPIPHPFVGYFLDPADYLPFIGATVYVNGMPRVQAGSGSGMPSIVPHIPIGGTFVQGVVDNEGEAFMGSSTVLAEGEPFSYLSLPVLSCSCIGAPPPPRPGKDGSVGLKMPTSIVTPIPAGLPVLVGGSPTISMTAMIMKGVMMGGGALLRRFRRFQQNSNFWRNLSQRLNRRADEIMGEAGNLRNRVRRAICAVTGHPVDIATGKVFTEHIDFELPGPIPLQWERVYFSTSIHQGPVGFGWHHRYDMMLQADLNEELVMVRLADGRLAGFPLLSLGEQYYERKEKLTLIRDQAGYALRDQAGLFYRFAPLHPEQEQQALVSIENRNGHRIRFSYDHQGYLQQIIDSTGRRLDIFNDRSGRILEVYGPHPDNTGQKVKLLSYTYDAQGNLTGTADALNQTFRYEYQGHLLIKETNRIGLSFYFEYDGADENARCARTWGDEGIYNHKLTYYLDQQMTVVENSLGHKTYHYYNDQGVVTETMDALGNSSMTVYNEYNEVVEEINELGLVTRYTYDERGNQISVTQPDDATVQMFYDEEDQLITAIDALGGRWKWTYDTQGNLLERLDCMERLTQYAYENGRLREVIDPAGNRTRLAYDAQLNLSALETPDGANSRWEYDQLGRCIAVTDPKGNVQRRRFDLLGRVVRVDEPDGNQRRLSYDGEGNVLHAQDQQHDVQFSYRGMNRLASRSEAGTTVEFHYDTEDQLMGIKNEHGFVYRFELDPLGNVAKEIGFDLQERIYERDAAGQVTLVRRPKGRWNKYDYDRTGRVLQVTYQDESQEKYEYRPDGELMLAENQYQKVAFERDPLARVLKEIQGEVEVLSEYDILGRRISLNSSLGAQIDISRNAMGDVEQLSAQEGDHTAWKATFQRDLLGLELERSLPGGIRSRMQRDKLGRPIHHQISGSKGSFMDKRYEWYANDRLRNIIDAKHGTTTFSHDELGNLAGAQYGDGTIEFRMPDAVGNLFRTRDRSDRKYGPAGQLLEANGTRYQYDAEGNLIRKIEKSGKTWEYHWNASGMLAKVLRPDGETVSFTYDALGRRLSKTFKSKTTCWVWDGNLPLHEWVEASKTAKEKPLWSSVTHSVERKEEILSTAPANGPPDELTTWIFEPESFAPVAKLQGEQRYSIVTDYLSTPTRMFSEQGEQIWATDTSIYGQLRNLEGERSACPFRYPGQYEDVETGLYYNRFRYYDPEGMYISQDLLKLGGGARLYSYVSNPNVKVDPSGLMPWMNGASATITAGEITESFESTGSSGAHAEMNGLNDFADRGLLQDQDVVISNVVGEADGITGPVGVCARCRGDIFDPLIEGGAESVTLPVTRSRQIQGSITIHRADFESVQREIRAAVANAGDSTVRRSEAAWDVLEKYSKGCT